MNALLLPKGLVAFLPAGALGWPHLQRLTERWLRRWGFALTGLAVGLSAVWLARPDVNEAHATALQAVAQLTQQLAVVPSGAPTQKPAQVLAMTDMSLTDAQRLWRGLPAWSQPELVWAAWQQALEAQGLDLQFLQPIPTANAQGQSSHLASHAAAFRVRGRFDDWARVWAACAESGPVCAIDRINVVATDAPDVVQIDAVMRIWMRPSDGLAADRAEVGFEKRFEKGAVPWSASAEPLQAHWMAQARTGVQPPSRSRVALFAQNLGAPVPAAQPSTTVADGTTPSTNTAGSTAAVVGLAVLPDDPQQWPLSRIRLAGLWQQGSERQAVLSAGTHWARVTLGQRVTLEGHRVVSITDEGVRLRLGMGPLHQLAWAEALQVNGSAGPEASQFAGPSAPTSTTGRQAK